MSNIDELRTLPLSERIQLVEDLWDTIVEDAGQVALSEAQKAELDRRLATAQEGIDWATLRERIRAGL